jgi:hypothetical protein
VGHFVYVGNGVPWLPYPSSGPIETFRGNSTSPGCPTVRNCVPILFDYPDNHPRGGYALYTVGMIVRCATSDEWEQFLQKHLPSDYVLEANALKWWQWAPGAPF